MQVFHGIEAVEDCLLGKTVVTVGSFDGVHRGHRLLVELMNKRAAEIDAQPLLITFEPHPRLVLKGENRLLSTLDEKLFLLEEAGAPNVLVINFTKEFSQTPYDIFVREILVGKLQAIEIFVGTEHHFGRNKQGGAEMFEELGLTCHQIERLGNISSTMVRETIESENLERAMELLCEKYLIFEPVADKNKILPRDLESPYIRRISNNK